MYLIGFSGVRDKAHARIARKRFPMMIVGFIYSFELWRSSVTGCGEGVEIVYNKRA